MRKVMIFLVLMSIGIMLHSASDVLKVAKEKIEKGEYQQAIDMLEDVVKKHKDLYEAYFMLGESYYKLEKYNKSYANLEKCIKLKKDFVPAHLIEINILEKDDNLKSAETKLKEVIEIKSKNAILWAKLGDICAALEKFDDAIKSYLESFKFDKKMMESAFKAVQIYMEKKNYKTALELLDKIEDDIEDDIEEDKDEETFKRLSIDCKYNILIQDAEKLFSDKKIKKSLEKYEDAKDIKESDMKLDVKIAECYYLLKEIDDANEILDEVLKQDKNNSDALRIKASIYYSQKRYKEAKKYILKAIENEEDNINKSKEEYLLGNIQERVGELDKAKQNYKQAIKSDSQNWKPYMRLGILQADDKEYDKSIKNLKKSAGLCKEDKMNKKIKKLVKQVKCYYNIDLGNKMFDDKLYRKAITYYDKALENEEKNLVAMVNKGNALISLKKSKSAAEIFERIIKKKEFIPAYLGLARAYKNMKLVAKAEKIYNKIKKIESTNWEVYYDTGIFYEQNKKYKKAIENYNKAKKLTKSKQNIDKINSRLIKVFYILGRKNMLREKFKTAKEYMNKALKLKGSFIAAKKLLKKIEDYEEWDKINKMMKKGNAFFKKNKFQKAIDVYKKVLKIKKLKAAAYNLANSYFLTEDYKKADKLMEKFVAKYNDDIDGIFLYVRVKIELKKYSDAERKLVSSLNKIGRKDKIYYYLAMVYEKQNRIKDAIKNYVKAIKLNKNNFDARINLGNLYYKQKEYSKAEAEYKAVLKRNMKNDVALYNLGYIYYKKNRLGMALTMFKKVEELIRNYSPLYFNIGRILYYKKDYFNALKYVKKAIKIRGKESIGYKWGKANIYVKLYKKEKKPKIRKEYKNIARKLLEECIYNKKNMEISAMARHRILEIEPGKKYLYTVQARMGKKFLPRIVGNIIYYYSPDTKEFVKSFKETDEKIWSVKVKGKPNIQYQTGLKYFYAGINTGEILVINIKNGNIKYKIDKLVSNIIPFEEGVLLLSKDSSELSYYKNGNLEWDVELSVKGKAKNRVLADKNIFFLNKEKLLCIDEDKGKIRWEYKGGEVGKAATYKNIVCLELKKKGKDYIAGVNSLTGKKLWMIGLKNELKERPYFSLNYIVFLLKDNSIVVSDNTGKIKWRKKINERVTSIATKEEQLILALASNKLYCYNVKSGKFIWRYKLNEKRLASNSFYTVYYQQ